MIWKSGRAIPSIFGIGGPGGWLRKWSLVCGGPVFFLSFFFFTQTEKARSGAKIKNKQTNYCFVFLLSFPDSRRAVLETAA